MTGARRKTGRHYCNAWRRERDSNPRYGLWPYTRFPGVHLQPLGHLSCTNTSLLRNHEGAQLSPEVRPRQRKDHAVRSGDLLELLEDRRVLQRRDVLLDLLALGDRAQQPAHDLARTSLGKVVRSEERRVGKEGRSRGSPHH